MITKICNLFPLVILLVFSGSAQSQGVEFINKAQLSSGLVSNPGADIYMARLDYFPRLALKEGKYKVGLDIGGMYSVKDLGGIFGGSVGMRLKEFTGGPISLGGIYLNLGHSWGTDDQRIIYGSVDLDLYEWFGLSLSYGRDYHFDQNLISQGIYFKFFKQVKDDF